jgi:hypothetical protein
MSTTGRSTTRQESNWSRTAKRKAIPKESSTTTDGAGHGGGAVSAEHHSTRRDHEFRHDNTRFRRRFIRLGVCGACLGDAMKHVAGICEWRDPEEDPPPLGSKMLLLNPAGVACIGTWSRVFIAWAPLPKIPPNVKQKLDKAYENLGQYTRNA